MTIIEGQEKLTDMDISTIMAYAACDMNIQEASRMMYCHRNTVISHLIKVWSKTGLNPKKFYDLVALINAIEENQNNGTIA